MLSTCFRNIDPSTIVNAKVYVFHVKEVSNKDWDANDLIYGLCMEDKRLSHPRFKKMCLDNGRYFFSKTVNERDLNGKVAKTCTWEQIQQTLKDWTPIGSPVIALTESPTSFSAIASLTYERGIFSNAEAWRSIFGGDNVKMDNSDAIVSEPKIADPKTIVNDAKKKADEFSQRPNIVKDLTQSARILTGNYPGDDDSVEIIEERPLESYSHEDLLNIAYEYKEKHTAAKNRVSLLQAELNAKEFRVQDLENKLTEAKAKLRVSDTAKVNFMSAGDRLAAEKKILIEGISHDIAEELKPLIKQQMDSYTDVTESKKKIDKKLIDIHENAVRIGKNIIRSQSDIETATDLVHGVTDSLSKAGINESCSVDLSSSVASIMKHLGVGKEDLSTDEVAQSGSHNFQQPQDNLVYMQTPDIRPVR